MNNRNISPFTFVSFTVPRIEPNGSSQNVRLQVYLWTGSQEPLMMKRQGSAAFTAASKILRRTKRPQKQIIRKRTAVRTLPAARAVSKKTVLKEPTTCSALYDGVSDKWKAVISDAIMDAVSTSAALARRSRHGSDNEHNKPTPQPEEPAVCSSLYAGVSDQWKTLISDAINDAVTKGPNPVQKSTQSSQQWQLGREWKR